MFLKFPQYRREKMGGFIALIGKNRGGGYDAISQHEGLTTVDHGWVTRMTSKAHRSVVPFSFIEKVERPHYRERKVPVAAYGTRKERAYDEQSKAIHKAFADSLKRHEEKWSAPKDNPMPVERKNGKWHAYDREGKLLLTTKSESVAKKAAREARESTVADIIKSGARQNPSSKSRSDTAKKSLHPVGYTKVDGEYHLTVEKPYSTSATRALRAIKGMGPYPSAAMASLSARAVNRRYKNNPSKSTKAGRAAVLRFLEKEGISIVRNADRGHRYIENAKDIVVMLGDGTWIDFDTQEQVSGWLKAHMEKRGMKIHNPSPSSRSGDVDDGMAYEIASYLRWVDRNGDALATHLKKTAKKADFSAAKYADFLAKSHLLNASRGYLGGYGDTPNVPTRKSAGLIFVDRVLSGEWA